MGVSSNDLSIGIVNVWEATELEWQHKQLWAEGDRDFYSALVDASSEPAGIPHPYTVFEIDPLSVITRMSGATITSKYQTRQVPLIFRIHAKQTESKSAKEIAGDLIDTTMRVFGGHPTIKPRTIELTHGNVLNQQYDTDYPTAEGDDTLVWVLSYNLTLDVPVEIG